MNKMEVSGKRKKTVLSIKKVSVGRIRDTSTSDKDDSEEESLLCKVCSRNGQSQKAVGFCVDCSDHLCNTCFKSHLGLRSFGSHHLLDKFNMPRKPFDSTDTCTTHPDTPIEYICKKQDQLLCRHCLILCHKSCEDDELISKACTNVEESSEFKHLLKELSEIQMKIKQHSDFAQQNLTEIDKNRADVRRNIADFREELYQLVDNLVEKMNKELEDVIDTNRAITNKNIANCKEMAGSVHDFLLELDIKKKLKSKSQLFIAMKTTQSSKEMVMTKLEGLDTKTTLQTLTFEPAKQLRDIVGSEQKLGQLIAKGTVDVGPTSACGSRVLSQTDDEKNVFSKINEIAADIKEDVNECSIFGIDSLDSDSLVIVDSNNYSVKLLSLRQRRVTHHLFLEYIPGEVTTVGEDAVAVLFAGISYIQLVTVSKSGAMSIGKQIKTQGGCCGLQTLQTSVGCRLIVGLVLPCRIHIIDLSGAVLKEILKPTVGKSLLSAARHIIANKDASVVYMSDEDSNCVIGMTMDGQVVFTYRDDQLKCPRGLAMVEDDVLLVCGSESNNIHMVSGAGKKIKVVLWNKHGIVDPISVMYNRTDHRLYVGMGSSKVNVFELGE